MQKTYLKGLECSTVEAIYTTPLNISEKLQLCDSSGKADEKQYRRMVGGLLYLTHMRPDLTFAVSLVSRYMQSPTKHHMGSVKRIFHYVSSIVNKGIRYKYVKNFELKGYVDSDQEGCVDDRQSTTNWVFDLGSGAIVWSSKKQEVIALSSTKAKYVDMTSAACQAVWMRRLLVDLGVQQYGPTIIFCDNQFAIAITRNPKLHGHTKHIDVRFHFI